ncbi:hypothetical protein C7C46_13715 [Streptomyces tateyamensis]|uniref:CBM6 domain-containing protein n=1 Tax=Streptomyces tateyamensis TaxID=565073 RepID=A0A2V4NT87_9ACTN|nr:hypothetical protein C7C46_13715 [Streptomyces tateyamensis]
MPGHQQRGRCRTPPRARGRNGVGPPPAHGPGRSGQVAVHHAAAVAAEVDTAVHVGVAGDDGDDGPAVLVLVVVDPDPGRAGVGGAEQPGHALDRPAEVEGLVAGARRRPAEAEAARLVHPGDLGEARAAVGGVQEAVLPARDPQVARDARDRLELTVTHAGGAGGEVPPAVGAGVQGAAAEGVEGARGRAVGHHGRVLGQAGDRRPGRAVVGRQERQPALRGPHHGCAVRRDCRGAADGVARRRRRERRPVRSAVGRVGAVLLPAGPDPHRDLRLGLGEVDARGGGELRSGQRLGSGLGQVVVPETADAVRDVWSRTEVGSFGTGYTTSVPAADAVMLTVTGTEAVGTVYEAESAANTRTGSAVDAACANCSGATKVGYVGNGAANTLRFNGITAAGAGIKVLDIAYVNGDSRSRTAVLQVNGQNATTVSFPPTGSWSAPGTVSVEVALAKGSGNTLAFSNTSGWAPDFDAVKVGDLPGTNGTEIVGQQSGRCADLFNSTIGNGTQAALWDCNGGGNQSWTYTTRKELVVYGNKCLDAYQAGTTSGTKVVIWDCTGGNNQKWSVNADGTITNVNAGLCLDASGAATANGTALDLWACHGGGNQKWTLQ